MNNKHNTRSGGRILIDGQDISQVDQDKVVVGSAGYEVHARFHQLTRKGRRVFHDLLLVDIEFIGKGFPEGNGLGGSLSSNFFFALAELSFAYAFLNLFCLFSSPSKTLLTFFALSFLPFSLLLTNLLIALVRSEIFISSTISYL